jgi:hypothetical protein
VLILLILLILNCFFLSQVSRPDTAQSIDLEVLQSDKVFSFRFADEATASSWLTDLKNEIQFATDLEDECSWNNWLLF